MKADTPDTLTTRDKARNWWATLDVKQVDKYRKTFFEKPYELINMDMIEEIFLAECVNKLQKEVTLLPESKKEESYFPYGSIEIKGEAHQLNKEGTEVFYFGWRDIRKENDGRKYIIIENSKPIYLENEKPSIKKEEVDNLLEGVELMKGIIEDRNKEIQSLKGENERIKEALSKIIIINAAPSMDELISKLKLVAYAALYPDKKQ